MGPVPTRRKKCFWDRSQPLEKIIIGIDPKQGLGLHIITSIGCKYWIMQKLPYMYCALVLLTLSLMDENLLPCVGIFSDSQFKKLLWFYYKHLMKCHLLANLCWSKWSVCDSEANLGRPLFIAFILEYNIHEPEYNLPEPEYNLPEPDYNLTEPEYNLTKPEYNLPEPVVFTHRNYSPRRGCHRGLKFWMGS